MDENTGECFLEVDLGKHGGILRFDTFPAVETWFNDEFNFWNWVENTEAQQRHSIFDKWRNNGIGRLRSALESARQEVRRARLGFEGQAAAYVKGAILETMTQAPVLLLSSQSPEAKYLESIREENPNVAAYALAHFLGLDFDLRFRDAREGVAKAISMRMPVVTPTTAFDEAFAAQTQRWRDEISSYRSKYEELKLQLDEIHQKYGQLKADSEGKFSNFLAESTDDFKTLKSTYEAHLKLESPVKYWSEKKTLHKDRRKAMTWVSVIVLLLGGGSLCFLVIAIFPLSTQSGVPWESLALFIIFSSVFFWISRICIRILLSNAHLESDAYEREVMAMTYLAFVRGEKGQSQVSEKDIGVILAALFRPSSSGIIGDDGAPVGFYEIVQSVLQKDKT